jgi:hypothetical protein
VCAVSVSFVPGSQASAVSIASQIIKDYNKMVELIERLELASALDQKLLMTVIKVLEFR